MRWFRPGLIIAAVILSVLLVVLVVTRGSIFTTSRQDGGDEERSTARAYNLSWVRPPEPVELKLDESVAVENEISMQGYTEDGQPVEGESLSEICGAAPWIYWYLADRDGTLVRDLWPRVTVPEDLRSGEARATWMTVTAQQDDPREGYIVGVIDLPGVMALAGDDPADALVAEVVAVGRALELTPQPACQPEKYAETREAPVQEAPLSGLADNVLKIPYAIYEEPAPAPEEAPAPERRPDPPQGSGPQQDPAPAPAPEPEPVPDPVPDPGQATFHDCRVATLTASRSPIIPDWIQYVVGLNYDTNSGNPGIFAQYRVWARTGPNSTAPVEAWQPVTIPARSQSWVLEGAFEGLTDGYWEIAAEVSCAGDSDPTNNFMVVPVQVGNIGVAD